MRFNNSIMTCGKLKITTRDAVTGKILQCDEGDNLILNSGLSSLCNLISGNFVVSDVASTVYSAAYAQAVPLYIQFGSDATPVSSSDRSGFPNGTLDEVTSSPSKASDIVKGTITYPGAPYSNNPCMFQFFLGPTNGNGIGDPGVGLTYREAVLMSRGAPVGGEERYTWFARRSFPDILKTGSILLEAEWTFTFNAKEA